VILEDGGLAIVEDADGEPGGGASFITGIVMSVDPPDHRYTSVLTVARLGLIRLEHANATSPATNDCRPLVAAVQDRVRFGL
jgi:hypothetical protein